MKYGSHGWKYLERGFKTRLALEKRFMELLKDPKYIQG